MKIKLLFILFSFSLFSVKGQLTATTTQIPETCDLSGVISVFASGSFTPYLYSVVPTGDIPLTSSFISNNHFELEAGIYDVYITDSSEELVIEKVVVEAILAPEITISLIEASCIEDTGGVQGQITGGTPPFAVELLKVGSNNVFEEITSTDGTVVFGIRQEGDFELRVTDSYGCIITSSSFIIEYPKELISSATIAKENSCLVNGEIVFEVASGGTAPYFYGINGVFSEELVKSNLLEGSYELAVKDTNGCEIDLDTLIIEPVVLPMLNVTSTDSSCSVLGSIEIEVLVGTPPYLLNLRDVTGAVNISETILVNNYTFTDLMAAGYIVEIISSNGCNSFSDFVSISNPDELSLNAEVVNPLCFGENNGEIIVEAIGGVPPYQFSVDGGVTWSFTLLNESTYVFTGLRSGEHIVYVRDSSSCIFQKSIHILESAPLVVEEPMVTQFGCTVGNVSNVASIAIDGSDVTGGTGNYIYSLYQDIGVLGDISDDVLLTTSSFTGTISSYEISDTSGGDYYYVISDSGGCQEFSNMVTVLPFNEIVLEWAIIKEVDALTGAVVELYANASVNNESLVYNITNDSGDYEFTNDIGVFSDIPVGIYVLSVTNTISGCISIGSLVIDPFEIINEVPVAVDDFFFMSEDGSLVITALDNDTDIHGDTLTIIEVDGKPIVVGTSISIVGGIITVSTVRNMVFEPEADFAGMVTIPYVIDDGNGGRDTANIMIEISSVNDFPVAADDTAFTTEDIAINGYSILSNDSDADGDTITLTKINGVPIVVGSPISVFNGTVAVNTLGTIDFEPSIGFTGVVTVPYEITDGNGGTATANIIFYVEAPEVLPLNLVSVFGSDLACFGDSSALISVTIAGGIVPYTYQLLDGNSVISEITGSSSLTNTFVGLSSGSFKVLVTDATGITIENIVTIDGAIELVATSEITNPTCNGSDDGVITVNTTGGSGSYTYSISSEDPNRFQTSNVFEGLPGGIYDIVVLDEFGCFVTQSVEVEEPDAVVINSIAVLDSGNLASGNIQAGAIGGDGNYSFIIEELNITVSNQFFDLEAGVYQIIASDSNGCVSIPFSVTIGQIDIDNSIIEALDGGLEANFKDAFSYQWINADTNTFIEGATNVNFIPSQYGNYQVQLTIGTSTALNKGGIKTNTTEVVLSPIINYSSGVLGLDDVKIDDFKVYPNPTVDFITVPVSLLGLNYSIFDMLGKKIESGSINGIKFNVAGLGNGIYFLKVDTHKAVKFVKK